MNRVPAGDVRNASNQAGPMLVRLGWSVRAPSRPVLVDPFQWFSTASCWLALKTATLAVEPPARMMIGAPDKLCRFSRRLYESWFGVL